MSTDQLVITNFTDPLCTWCWGSEPIFRKLETHFPGQVTFRYIMGGLVENVSAFRDPRNDIGGSSMEETNRQVAKHWLEAAERHGMPVESRNFAMFSEAYPSTYPQNIAYKAAQKSDPQKADQFLRRMREASAAEAQLTSREDILVSLAAEVGLNVPLFIKYLKDRSAEQEFLHDLALTRSLGVRGFPAFMVEYGDKQVMLRGFNTYETFVSVIDVVSAGKLKPTEPENTDEALLSFLGTHSRLAAEEIRMAYDLDEIEAVDKWVKRLADEGKLVIIPAGTSYFVSRKTPDNATSCDLGTGKCG